MANKNMSAKSPFKSFGVIAVLSALTKSPWKRTAANISVFAIVIMKLLLLSNSSEEFRATAKKIYEVALSARAMPQYLKAIGLNLDLCADQALSKMPSCSSPNKIKMRMKTDFMTNMPSLMYGFN
jgi:hypothetical protein